MIDLDKVSVLTITKAKCLTETGFDISGFVMRKGDEVCIVDMDRVKCFSQEAWEKLFNPLYYHLDDEAVDKFAVVMKHTLAQAREQGKTGWNNKIYCSNKILSDLLLRNVRTGDPVDVANFAMMLFNRNERISTKGWDIHRKELSPEESNKAFKDFGEKLKNDPKLMEEFFKKVGVFVYNKEPNENCD